MDGIIRKFKGTVKLPRNKLISRVMNQVAEPNASPAVSVPFSPTLKFPLFTNAPVTSSGYNSDDDPEVVDSDDEIPTDAASAEEVSVYLSNHHL